MFKARVIIREEQRKSNMYHGVREGIIRPCRVLNRVIHMRRTDRPIGEAISSAGKDFSCSRICDTIAAIGLKQIGEQNEWDRVSSPAIRKPVFMTALFRERTHDG